MYPLSFSSSHTSARDPAHSPSREGSRAAASRTSATMVAAGGRSSTNKKWSRAFPSALAPARTSGATARAAPSRSVYVNARVGFEKRSRSCAWKVASCAAEPGGSVSVAFVGAC